VATKKPKITAYVDLWVDTAIDQESAKERRSRSSMIALLIEEALSARGYSFSAETIDPSTEPSAQ
jgi:hypothetical protein